MTGRKALLVAIDTDSGDAWEDAWAEYLMEPKGILERELGFQEFVKTHRGHAAQAARLYDNPGESLVSLSGPHRELYDVLQEQARLVLQRASGAEVAALPDNETLAQDIGCLSLESVERLLRQHSAAGRVW